MISCVLISVYLQAVELDPFIVDIARGYFGFAEDERLKVVKYIPWHTIIGR